MRLYARALGEDEVSDLVAEPVRLIVAMPTPDRSEEQQAELKNYVHQHRAPTLLTAEKELAARRKAEEELEKTIPTIDGHAGDGQAARHVHARARPVRQARRKG